MVVNWTLMLGNLHGILPAVVTPFTADGVFHEAAFERLLAHVYDAGVHGVYVCGQTGEGLQQSPEQRKKVTAAAVRLSPPGKQVIVHVGAASTSIAIDLARHAESQGASAISSLPPAAGYSFPEILAYYEAIAASTSLPVLVYFFPQVAPALSTFQQIEQICSVPNVAGLKFTDMDLYKLSRLKQAGKVVFNGYDEVLVAGLLMGADGGIGSFYNVAPRWFAELYDAARVGNWEAASLRQKSINELITAGIRYPVNSAVKVMLSWLGIDCGECLPPRRPLTPHETRELVAWLDQSELAADRH